MSGKKLMIFLVLATLSTLVFSDNYTTHSDYMKCRYVKADCDYEPIKYAGYTDCHANCDLKKDWLAGCVGDCDAYCYFRYKDCRGGCEDEDTVRQAFYNPEGTASLCHYRDVECSYKCYKEICFDSDAEIEAFKSRYWHGECVEPEEDYDADGIFDNVDLCKFTKGTQKNFGCPEIGVSPGGLLIRPGLASYLTLGNHGHVGMYMGECEVEEGHKARLPVTVYRPDSSDEYSEVSIKEGDMLQKGDVIQECIVEVNKGHGGGAMFSNLDNFNEQSQWTMFKDVGVEGMSKNLTYEQVQTLRNHMFDLIKKTEAGELEYSLWTTGPVTDEETGETKYYYSCVTAFESAYEKIYPEGIIPSDHEKSKWVPLSPNEFYRFFKKEEGGVLNVFKVLVRCPVEVTAKVNGKTTGEIDGERVEEIPDSQYIILDDDSKLLLLFDVETAPEVKIDSVEDGEFTVSTLDSFSSEDEMYFVDYPSVYAEEGTEYTMDASQPPEERVLYDESSGNTVEPDSVETVAVEQTYTEPDTESDTPGYTEPYETETPTYDDVEEVCAALPISCMLLFSLYLHSRRS